MTKTFQQGFREALLAAKMDGTELHAKTDVSLDIIKKLRTVDGYKTNVEAARKLANGLGLSLDELMDDDTALIRSEIVAKYRALTDREVAILRAVPQAPTSPDRDQER